MSEQNAEQEPHKDVQETSQEHRKEVQEEGQRDSFPTSDPPATY